jgi:aminoglycoside phosphotransferase family enzyme
LREYLFLKNDLEDVDDKSCAAEWGGKKTSSRLKKMADSVAEFVRNAKRNPHDYIEAIHEWESGLSYIKATFYDGWHKFPWPNLDT